VSEIRISDATLRPDGKLVDLRVEFFLPSKEKTETIQMVVRHNLAASDERLKERLKSIYNRLVTGRSRQQSVISRFKGREYSLSESQEAAW